MIGSAQSEGPEPGAGLGAASPALIFGIGAAERFHVVFATIAAGRYGHAPEVYTFGSPRVGDGRYVEGLDVTVYHFVNGGDVVPKLPVGGSYRHAGVEKYIDEEGGIHGGKPGGDGLRAKGRRLVQRLRPFRPSGGTLQDHSPVLYAVHIWNAYVGG